MWLLWLTLPSPSRVRWLVNSSWIRTTKEMRDAQTAYRACTIPGVLERLVAMDDKLDKIQKSLDEYLETKRQAFPRFYFLSKYGGRWHSNSRC